MGTFLLLAAEASHSEGIGFNPDIFEANVINLAVVIGLLYYAGSRFLGKTLSARREGIEAEIKEVETRLAQAESGLAEQNKNLAEAKAEADRILAEAKERASSARDAIAAQATKDVERMKASAAQDLSAEQERVITQLRQRAVNKALEKVREQLPSRLDDGKQQELVDRSIALLNS